jgi:hypothetical protein
MSDRDAAVSLPIPFLAAAVAMAIGRPWKRSASMDSGYVIL